MLSWHRLAGKDALHRPQAQCGFLIWCQCLQLQFGGRLLLDDGLGHRSGRFAGHRQLPGRQGRPLRGALHESKIALDELFRASHSDAAQRPQWHPRHFHHKAELQAAMDTCSGYDGRSARHVGVWGVEPELLEQPQRWTMTWMLTHQVTWLQAARAAAAAAVGLVGLVAYYQRGPAD